LPYLILLLFCLLSLGRALDRLFPLDLQPAHEHSVLVLDAQDKLLRGFTTAAGTWRLPLQPDSVDPLYLKMLTAYEDRRFAWHPGVDPLAVMRALGQWLVNGRMVSGASTLTMQTVRLLEPRPRVLTSKLVEMLRALQLEWHLDKEEILALYLNLAPYGGNLEGLRAASLAYFGKEPTHLTPAEAALLVALPQAPSRLRPDRFPERARTARNKVLAHLEQRGILTHQQAAEARQEGLSTTRQAMPWHAPHLARYLQTLRPQQALHRTFIDGTLQQTLENLASQYPLDHYGNLAILVVAKQSRRVIAYLGSAAFFAPQRAGQVDMVRAIRSPGSVLKPLIYGLGFDELLIHPETLVDDVPTRFGSYSPTNFSNTYAGQISVREALQRSLNVPAVAVLAQLGPERVSARLRAVGVPLYWNGDHPNPGLPLVLGGVGTTLKDLVTLYTGIANGGIVSPLRFSVADALGEEQRLLSEAASWYLARILEETLPPPELIVPPDTQRPRPIAYKTGTSYGFRDAWALGFDHNYTVGVWVGRPDGSPSPGHYGRNTAAPLLFRVFELLPQPSPQPPEPLPQGVLLASHGQLPERLQHLRTQTESWSSTAPPLSISFPVHGTTVELTSHDGHLADLPLVAQGGKRPLRWLVNGVPLSASPSRRQAQWTPDGAGSVRITVLDAAGQSASTEVWIMTNDR
jgi:penicillin-binding protein 1C